MSRPAFAWPQVAAAIALAISPLHAQAAKPTAKEALSLVPVQKDVDYHVPDAKEIERCAADVITAGGVTGYVVPTDSGQGLRRFPQTKCHNKRAKLRHSQEAITDLTPINA